MKKIRKIVMMAIMLLALGLSSEVHAHFKYDLINIRFEELNENLKSVLRFQQPLILALRAKPTWDIIFGAVRMMVKTISKIAV